MALTPERRGVVLPGAPRQPRSRRLVPWGVLPCAAGISAIGLGVLSRDGVFILAGIAFAVAASGLGLTLAFT